MALYADRPGLSSTKIPRQARGSDPVDEEESSTPSDVPADVPIVAAAASGQLPSWRWGIASLLVFGAALIASVWLFQGTGNPTFAPPDGLGVFALFYVVAQAAERLVAMILGAASRLPGLDKPAKQTARDAAVAKAVGARWDAPGEAKQNAEAAAQAEADVQQVRRNRAAVAFGLTAAIAMLVCGYVGADFLSAVGVEFGAWGRGDEFLTMAVTGLVVGGGSKPLNDLIGAMSKKSDEKSTPPETGGKAGKG